MRERMPKREVIHYSVGGKLPACGAGYVDHLTAIHAMVTCRRCLAIIAKRQPKAAP
jgi:hypothetical protein